ncbi:prohibitin family protein [Candidatus Nitrospira nitrosa]|nr:prohibitin family protein [Candidatus Nitrospira nitrosa]
MKAMLLVAVLLVLQACGTTVHQGQRGVRSNLLTGGQTNETLKSGFYWRAPWNQIDVYNVKWRSYVETAEALSSDGLPVIIKTIILIRPTPDELPILAKNIGPDFYPRVAKPELLAAVRSAVSKYPMVTVLEHSSEIANMVEAVMVNKLKARHLQVASVAMLADIELVKVGPVAVEYRQAKEQEREPKEFELITAEAENARRRAIGENHSLRIRSDEWSRKTGHLLNR